MSRLSALSGIVVGAAAIAAGCSSGGPATAKENVRRASRDGARVVFGHTWTGNTGKSDVLCGEANFPNGFGGMTGLRGFVAGIHDGDAVLIQGESIEVSGIDAFDVANQHWCLPYGA